MGGTGDQGSSVEQPPLLEAQIAHLGLVQAVISRQAGNSFLIKGWALTITAALFGFAIGRDSWQLAALAFGPVLVFSWLDAYYFRQERLFRCLYNALVESDDRIAPFSMNIELFRDNESVKWVAAVKSLPYAVLYGSILIAGGIILGILAYLGISHGVHS
jgi:hypothetical protein